MARVCINLIVVLSSVVYLLEIVLVFKKSELFHHPVLAAVTHSCVASYSKPNGNILENIFKCILLYIEV